jgi:hypothetical protein
MEKQLDMTNFVPNSIEEEKQLKKFIYELILKI